VFPQQNRKNTHFLCFAIYNCNWNAQSRQEKNRTGQVKIGEFGRKIIRTIVKNIEKGRKLRIILCHSTARSYGKSRTERRLIFSEIRREEQDRGDEMLTLSGKSVKMTPKDFR